MIVFVNFLNHPSISRSNIPSRIALFATLIALLELLISIFGGDAPIYHKTTLFLFFGIIILFGYFLEISFVKMGEEVLCENISTSISSESKTVFQNGQAKQTVNVWPVGGIFPIGCQKLNFVLTDADIKISRKGANELLFFVLSNKIYIKMKRGQIHLLLLMI